MGAACVAGMRGGLLLPQTRIAISGESKPINGTNQRIKCNEVQLLERDDHSGVNLNAWYPRISTEGRTERALPPDSSVWLHR